ALHWAAQHGDAELASLLLTAGAGVRATTRLGGYTPLHLASAGGSAAVIKTLAAAGADVNARTATGATPLMLAASSGAADAANGETALIFAAALDRADAVRALVQRGADAAIASRAIDLSTSTAPEEVLQNQIRDAQNAKSAAAAASGSPQPPAERSSSNP